MKPLEEKPSEITAPSEENITTNIGEQKEKLQSTPRNYTIHELLPSLDPFHIYEEEDQVADEPPSPEIPEFQKHGVPKDKVSHVTIQGQELPLNTVHPSYLSYFILQFLKSLGYETIQDQALEILTDVLSTYIERLGFLANSFVCVPGLVSLEPMDLMNKVFLEMYPKGLEAIREFWTKENKRNGIVLPKRQKKETPAETTSEVKADITEDIDMKKDPLVESSLLTDSDNLIDAKTSELDSSEETTYLMREQCLQNVPFTKVEQKSYEILYKDAFRPKSLRFQQGHRLSNPSMGMPSGLRPGSANASGYMDNKYANTMNRMNTLQRPNLSSPYFALEKKKQTKPGRPRLNPQGVQGQPLQMQPLQQQPLSVDSTRGSMYINQKGMEEFRGQANDSDTDYIDDFEPGRREEKRKRMDLSDEMSPRLRRRSARGQAINYEEVYDDDDFGDDLDDDGPKKKKKKPVKR